MVDHMFLLVESSDVLGQREQLVVSNQLLLHSSLLRLGRLFDEFLRTCEFYEEEVRASLSFVVLQLEHVHLVVAFTAYLVSLV